MSFLDLFRRAQDKNVSKLNILSDNGKELISKCQRKRTITGRDNIIQKLHEEKIPISKAIVDFQEFYGGLNCQFGGSTEQGFLLDLFSNCHCDYKKPQVYTYNNQYLVECIHNYDIWTIRGFIGEDGKIYRCIQEKFSIIADSINEFLDSNAIIYHFLMIQKQWLRCERFDGYEFYYWQKNEMLSLIELKEYSNQYTKWWKTKDNKIFISTNYQNGDFKRGTAYIADKAALQRLGISKWDCNGFPFHANYNFDKSYAEIYNTQEQFYFNNKLYSTCNCSQVNVSPINDVIDVYSFLAGQKKCVIRETVIEVTNNFSSVELKCDDFDNELACAAYSAFEPAILFFALGGSFSTEHGLVHVEGLGAFYLNSWRTQAGKVPIDIYKEAFETWNNRNFKCAIDKINRIRWEEKGEQFGRIECGNNKDIEKLISAIINMYGGSYEEYSFLYLARRLGGKPIENLKTFCSDLGKIEGTLIWFICESYLEWAILIDSGNNEALNNPCLYEPFIEDMIRFQQGYIDSFSALIRNILNSINIMKEEPIIRYSEFLKNREA